MIRQPPLRWRSRPLRTVAPEDVPALMRQLAPAAALTRAPGEEPAAEIELPALPGTPHGKAAVLLRAAAEVEHALMVQYLYAAYSLATTDSTIATVAVEEMSHLMTVQNLLRCIGEPPHLLRQDDADLDEDQRLFPFRFTLEPVSAASLAKYVVAESPDTGPPGAAPPEIVPEVLATITTLATGAETVPIHRVGVLYALLGVVFADEQALTGHPGDPWYDAVRLVAAEAAEEYGSGTLHLPDDAFDAASAANQGSDPDWDRTRATTDRFFRVHLVTSRDSSLEALRDIGLQGEGPAQVPGEKSHFQRFYDLFVSYFGNDGTGGGPPAGVRAVPAGPVIRIDPGGIPAADAITEATSAKWARLADMRYALLVGVLERFLLEPPADRAFLRGWCFAEMAAMRSLGAQLREMPRTTNVDASDASAALPFTAPQWPDGGVQWTDLAAAYTASRDHLDTLLAAEPVDTRRHTLLSELRASDDRKQAECTARAAGGTQRSRTDEVRDVLDWTAGAGNPSHAGDTENLRFWNKPHEEFTDVDLGLGPMTKVPPATEDDPDPVAPLIQVLTPNASGTAFMPRNRRSLAEGSTELELVRRWVADGAPDTPAPTATEEER